MKNYKIKKRLICGKMREFVLMPTYNGEIKELWQEIAEDKDAYYVYSYMKEINGDLNHRYLGIGNFGRYKSAKRKNNKTLTGSIKKNTYYKIIVARCDIREGAAAIERNLISFFGRKDLGTGDLYNLSDGGENHKPISQKERRKRSKRWKGRNNPFYKTNRRGASNPNWIDKSNVKDYDIFLFLQLSFNIVDEFNGYEWGFSFKAFKNMLRDRFGIISTRKVLDILCLRMGFQVLNNENFIKYYESHSKEFFQKANEVFGVSGEQLQRWCSKKYKNARTQTLRGWYYKAKALNRSIIQMKEKRLIKGRIQDTETSEEREKRLRRKRRYYWNKKNKNN